MQATADPLPIDLALQGGGSQGAFTWGVLDRLLEEERPSSRFPGGCYECCSLSQRID